MILILSSFSSLIWFHVACTFRIEHNNNKYMQIGNARHPAIRELVLVKQVSFVMFVAQRPWYSHYRSSVVVCVQHYGSTANLEHVFGIAHGFLWPNLMRRIKTRPSTFRGVHEKMLIDTAWSWWSAYLPWSLLKRIITFTYANMPWRKFTRNRITHARTCTHAFSYSIWRCKSSSGSSLPLSLYAYIIEQLGWMCVWPKESKKQQ